MSQHDEHLLREHGLRVTAPRLAVLRAVSEAPHSDADHLHRLLVAAGSAVTLQSVHNVLADLDRAGLIRRFEPARSAARFERRINDNHHHAVCTECGAIFDVDCIPMQAPCLQADLPSGFTAVTAEVTFMGRCASCSQRTTTPQVPRGSDAGNDRHPQSFERNVQ